MGRNRRSSHSCWLLSTQVIPLSTRRVRGLLDLMDDQMNFCSFQRTMIICGTKTGSPLHIDAFVEFLETIRPDVVHFHHFLTLGIDLITLTRRVLPESRIVFTFHEFLSICDAHGHMVRTTDKSLCTHASPVRCHQVLSRALSGAVLYA